ncbi:MAG: hypothetical protein M3150_03230 [Pseudomonadota bacterium]|nr:hypothetical protein [Pseudomonadota bacterium]
MTKSGSIAISAAAGLLALSLEALAVAGWIRAQGPGTPAPALVARTPLRSVPPVAVAPPAEPISLPAFDQGDRYYAQLRLKIRWVETRIGSDKLLTPDDHSRVLLAKSAADRAGLHEVGLSYKDVYGIINAETSWIPRMGTSKDGTPNLGLAQFEPATARALGLRDPNDPVEAIHAAALHMKEAAEWSAGRISNLDLSAGDRAEKLRDGVSVFYNLSSRGRSRWNGTNIEKLPIETRRHIRNARSGAQYAAGLEAQQASPGFMLTGG